MEKLAFQKTLNEVGEKGIVVKQLTTGRYIQIPQYFKENESQIDRQLDV